MKNYLELGEGRSLAFHRPRPPEEIIDLRGLIPEGFKEIEVEIGSGTGRFLAARAQIYRDRFFIGIDKKKDRFDATFDKLERLGQTNWKILRSDARSFLENPLPPLKIVHLYHPDPWPKKNTISIAFFVPPMQNIGPRPWLPAVNSELPPIKRITSKKY